MNVTNSKMTFFTVFCAGLGLVVGWILNDHLGGAEPRPQPRGRATRELAQCEEQLDASQAKARKMKRTLTESVEVIGDQWKELKQLRTLVRASRPTVDADPDVNQLYGLLQYCCDWPHEPLSEEQENCRHLLFGDNGSSIFRGEVRWWGGKRPSGPPPFGSASYRKGWAPHDSRYTRRD